MQNEKNNNQPDRELSISRLVKAPIDLVWRVWTEPEHIKHWWGPNGFTSTIFEMDVRPGGTWDFIMHAPDGTEYRNRHIYREVKKPEKLVMEHVIAPKFLMTISFTDQGIDTLVTIHSMFESPKQLQEVIKVFKADQGMKENFGRMENYVIKLNEKEVI